MRSPAPAFDLRAALIGELRSALEQLDAADREPHAVHRCRVHIKRARALARVGRACAPGLANVFNRSARAVMAALAGAREFQALAETARTTAKKAPRRAAHALHMTAAALDAERTALPARDDEAIGAAIKDLQALAQVWPEASPRQIKRGAKRIIGRARRARARGRGASEVALRHAWRKREKDRFYAAVLLDDAWPARRRRGLGEKLGNALGGERDALLLCDRLEREPNLAGGEKAARRAIKALRVRAAKMAVKADKIGARLRLARA